METSGEAPPKRGAWDCFTSLEIASVLAISITCSSPSYEAGIVLAGRKGDLQAMEGVQLAMSMECRFSAHYKTSGSRRTSLAASDVVL